MSVSKSIKIIAIAVLFMMFFIKGIDVHIIVILRSLFLVITFFSIFKIDLSTVTSFKTSNEEHPNSYIERRIHSSRNHSRRQQLLSASKSISIFPMPVSERTLCNGFQMQTPTVISDAFSGLTNVLFAMSAMVYLSSKLHVPFESVGFLDIGCSNA